MNGTPETACGATGTKVNDARPKPKERQKVSPKRTVKDWGEFSSPGESLEEVGHSKKMLDKKEFLSIG